MKQRFDVFSTSKKGRYSIILNDESYVGSKQTLFQLVGSSFSALQLSINFE